MLRRDRPRSSLLFFFNDTATTEIYTLSLHDALPISHGVWIDRRGRVLVCDRENDRVQVVGQTSKSLDRKSTRLNSSHDQISYAVFCLKKKKKTTNATRKRNATQNTQPLCSVLTRLHH